MSTHTILVVDDDRLVRETLCEMLSDLHCQASAVADAHHAMAHLGLGRFDLVVSDVDMPDISGFELLSRIRQQFGPRPDVVLMSARADNDLGRSARESGAIDFLAKPVVLDSLHSLIHRVWPNEHM
ncbi:MAG: response regulator [Planctomycetota bacterium]